MVSKAKRVSTHVKGATCHVISCITWISPPKLIRGSDRSSRRSEAGHTLLPAQRRPTVNWCTRWPVGIPQSAGRVAHNRHLHDLVESIIMNVGGSHMEGSSPPMKYASVGAIIVVRGWESQPQGEGWQESDVRQGEINRECSVNSGFPSGVAMKSHLDDASRNISGSGSRSLESPLQGNLHGGFGGGSEET
jgi:hypothetical protein